MIEQETQRLLLRQWKADDFETFAGYYANEQTAKYVGGVSDRDQSWRRMASLIGHWALKGYGYWAVEEKDDGRAGAQFANSPDTDPTSTANRGWVRRILGRIGLPGLGSITLDASSVTDAAGIDAVVDHLLHIIDVAGEDAAALGSDWDGFIRPTKGLEEVSKLPLLTDALLARGVPRRAIRKLLRENALRVLGDVTG